MNYFFALTLILSNFVFSDPIIKERLINNVSIKYEYNCNSIVEKIREDSREREIDFLDKLSIEQIYNRKRISINDSEVNCKGEGMLSNGERVKIFYGLYTDELQEKILYYRLNSN